MQIREAELHLGGVISELHSLLGWDKSQGYRNPETHASQHSVGGKKTFISRLNFYSESKHTHTHKEKLNHAIFISENWDTASVFEFYIQV